MDLREQAILPLESKKIPIVPGKPEQSEIIKRIFTTDEEELMPPPKSHKVLTGAQKAMLKQWVAEGAVYQKHWAFDPPVKTEPPAVRPGVKAINAIDNYIDDRLRREGLAMSREADRTTLIRRVAFTLTGLPPTVAEVDAFTGDTAEGAYERMVDRYIASPRFGEEMARPWLDVARFGDTHGLHLDNERQMWVYRDWVIGAFNANKPFDQFTIEQVAGDLLPAAKPEQVVATGFLRCGVTTGEGGSINEELIYRYAVDRANTVAEAWLGLTAGCAQCHDHKFDPLTAKDYYSLYAFFNSAADPGMDGNAMLTAPTIRLSKPEQEKRLADLDAKATALQKQIDTDLAALKYVDPGTVEPGLDVASEHAKDPKYSFLAWWKEGTGKDTPGLPKDISPIRKLGPGKAKPDKEKVLRSYYLQSVCVETKGKFDAMTKDLAATKKQREDLDKSIPATFVFRDLDKPRESFVMLRGQYNKPGEKVEPNTPHFLPALKKHEPAKMANRLDLANWLVAPEQPLTARVTVNRFWQQIFGTGIVKTSFDFGAQGEPPSHPELLDWLAVDFRESGWDVKRMVKQMVCSATFRQESAATAELLKRDADNRLYARGPRVRLDAEQIRDNALFASGLINLEMGGRGVNPYQPPNIWEPVGFGGSNTQNYKQDKGPALYRRSVYVFLKRTAPPPFMSNFDAPSREVFCTRRERSNTPLQALQLMNDVQHIEAARALGERLLTEGGVTPRERLDYAYRVVLSRRPTADETGVLLDALAKFLAKYQADPAAAKLAITHGESKPKAGLPEGELAAYTLMANLILNLDETLNRN